MEPGRFWKRSAVIEAMQLNFNNEGRARVWVEETPGITTMPVDKGFVISSAPSRAATYGDWIIKDPEDGIFVVDHETFIKQYEAVPDDDWAYPDRTGG